MTQIKFKRSDILEEDSQLIVFAANRGGMVAFNLFGLTQYNWDDWENLNQIGDSNKNLLLLDIEMASDDQNKAIIQKIIDLAVVRQFKSISFTGIRDTEQQHLTLEERIANQNRRCIQSVYEVLSYLNGKKQSIESFSFCSFTDDYFLRVFQEEIEV